MHRAGVDALAAADTLGILHALVLIASKGEECVGALDNRGIQRELSVAHHRAASQELVRSFLEAAAGVDQLFDWGADACFEVLRLSDCGTGDGNDTADNRHTGGEAAVNRTCGIYVEYRAASVCRQLAGRNFAAGAGIDQLLLSTLRVLTLQRIQLQAGIVRDQLFDLGEGILLVFLDCDDRGLNAHDVGQHLQAADGLFRTLEQQTVVGRDVRLTLCSVDDDRVALADTGLDLDMGREGCTAMADNAGRTDALDTLLIAHGSEVVGMHGLVLAVLTVVSDNYGKNLAAVRMQARLDRLYLTGNGCMDRSADEAAGFRDRLSEVHGVANRNDRLCRCADVHGNRQDYLIGQCQLLDRLGVCRGFIARVCVSTRVYAATERIRHFFHLSNILRKKNRTSPGFLFFRNWLSMRGA